MIISEIPAQYTHSGKLEDTAKGIRLTVHAYANDLQTIVNEAIELYNATKQKAKQEKIPVAPMELK